MDDGGEEVYELTIEDGITYNEEIEREELEEFENEWILIQGVDTEEDNPPEHIDQEESQNQWEGIHKIWHQYINWNPQWEGRHIRPII